MATRLCLSHAQPLLPLPTGHLHVQPQETQGGCIHPPHTQPSGGGGQIETSPIKHSQLVSFKKVVSGRAVSWRRHSRCREQQAQPAYTGDHWCLTSHWWHRHHSALQHNPGHHQPHTLYLLNLLSAPHPLPSPELLLAQEALRHTFLMNTFLTNSTVQTCRGRNTHGSDFPPPPEGSKALHCRTGMERTGITRDARYKYKIISATNRGRILYIFDPIYTRTQYTQNVSEEWGLHKELSEVPLLPSHCAGLHRWHIRASHHSDVHHADHMGRLGPPL